MSRLLLVEAGADLGPVGTPFALPERTMLHVLAWRASERPHRTWLQFEGADGSSVELTYGAAAAQVNQVAHAILDDLGGPVNLGLLLRNQVEFFPAFYGAMAARGVAVPLNADNRGILLERVIEQADVQAIVVRADLLNRLESLEGIGAVKRIVVTGAGSDRLPAVVHGAAVVRFEDWIRGRPVAQAAELPDSSMSR